MRALSAKRWGNETLEATVAALKDAAIGVSLTVLVGAGGVELEAVHLDATSSLVNALALGEGDLVALLDAREVARAGRTEGPEPIAFTPLTDARHVLQRDELRHRLAPLRHDRKAKVVAYSLEKQGAL